MKKTISILFLFLITASSFANTINFSKYFNEKSGCFILFDLNKNKLITKYNPSRCKERIAPDSTFKIPLSLMVFDQKLIKQKTVFKWDGKDRGFSFWNQDQTPQTWLKNSAVWVSQEIVPKLGLNKIKYYLKEFKYGNQDFSGDLGKNNGLTHAWLSSSLKISGDEQFTFLKRFFLSELFVSKAAMVNTKANMYLETSPNGWKLYGKTGSGSSVHQSVNHQHVLEDGWCVGCIQKRDQVYVFVLNFSDLERSNTSEAGGLRAKNMTKVLLEKFGVF